MQTPTLIEILLARFNGQVLIPFADALSVIGYNLQTARNQLSCKTFPIRTLLQGSRRYIAITDLAAYIDGLSSDRPSSQLQKKRGAPTKIRGVALLKEVQQQGRAS